MPQINKVEMSLDDIIKAGKGGNKKGVKLDKKNAGKQQGRNKLKLKLKGVTKRKASIGKKGIPKKVSRKFGVKKTGLGGRRTVQVKKSGTSSVATKRLVNKLVKRALAAQTRKRSILAAASRRVIPVAVQPQTTMLVQNISRRPIRSSGRLSKKAMVLSEISPKSRVIVRRRPVVVMPRQMVLPSAEGNKRVFAAQRPVTVRQRARPVYQIVPAENFTTRQQVSVIRRQQNFRQQQTRRDQQAFRPQQAQYNRQNQSRVVQQGQGRGRQTKRITGYVKNGVFYDTPNAFSSYLQRVPVQNGSGRRFKN